MSNGSCQGGWQSHGGYLASDPAAVSWASGRLDVFVRGGDNALWHKWWDGSRWSGWESLGGYLTSGPDVASWSPGRLDVVVRGGDNALWHKWWDGSRWSGWGPLGGYLTSNPTAVSWGPGHLDVFVRGGDNALWHKGWDGSRWSGWVSLGGYLTSGPDAASAAPDKLDVFVRGGDNALWQRSWDGSGWSPWISQGGYLTSDPAAVSGGAGRRDVVVRGGDNALWHKWLPDQSGAPNPLASRPLWIEPNTPAGRQASEWRLSRAGDAALMDRIATRPTSSWFGDWNTDVRTAVDAKVSQASVVGQLPVLVAYAIPHRDCGGFSGGGLVEDTYRAWIRSFSAGIGTRPAAVILEPDALAQLDCLDTVTQRRRLDLLREAVGVLDDLPATVVYLDAGHSAWKPAGVMAERLRAAGVSRARGFSLNVSNFMPTSDEVSYGQVVSNLVGGAHFVVDTSRNAQGSNRNWCNPAGRGLGTPPNTATGVALLDAVLWVKYPGESDGTCNGGPPAGQWWAEYAIELALRAA